MIQAIVELRRLEEKTNARKEVLRQMIQTTRIKVEPGVVKVLEESAAIGTGLQDMYTLARDELVKADAEITRLKRVVRLLLKEEE